MTDRILTTPLPLAGPTGSRKPVRAVLDVLISRNPLLGHGPRTHATGIVVASDARTPARRARRRPWDVDAPKVHLGHAGRAA